MLRSLEFTKRRYKLPVISRSDPVGRIGCYSVGILVGKVEICGIFCFGVEQFLVRWALSRAVFLLKSGIFLQNTLFIYWVNVHEGRGSVQTC